MIRFLTLVWLTIFVFSGFGVALDPQKAITQFVHTSWTAEQGAPDGIEAVAQTADGYLWLGTRTGLYHFDGVRFGRFEPRTGEALPQDRISRLLATRDGSLWVVFSAGGVSRLFQRKVTSYSERDGLPITFALAERRDGILIAATASGLRRFQDGRWTDVGKEWNFPAKKKYDVVYFDRGGTLWTVTEDRIIYLPPGQSRFEDPGERISLRIRSLYGFAQAPGGAVWFAQTARSARLIRPVSAAAAEPITEIQVGASSVLFDRNGSLWVSSIGDGLRRVAYPERIKGHRIAQFGPEAEQYTTKQELSGNYVTSMIEDREGNIWCGTHAGLDRFRDSAFTSVPIPASDIPRFILATRDGSLWAFSASGGGIVRIAPGGQQELVDRIPIWAASEDENGVLWAVCVRPVFTLLLHLQEGRFVGVPLPGVNVLGGMDAMTTDPTRSTWLLEEAKGLFRLADGKLTNIRSRKDQVRSGGALLTDHLGRVWMADESRVLLSSQGVVQEFGPNEGVPLGPVFALHEDGAGNIWMGGESGLSKFDGSRFRALLDGDTLPLRSVSGIAEDQDGSWWVVADTGVIRIPAAELDHAFGDPSYRFRSQRFDTLDGLPAKARQAHRGPGAARTSDGRIWVATTSGLAFVDPRRLLKNDVPPPLQVEAVKIGGRQTAPADNVVYPHGTNDIEIDYTALSLSIPERVFFKYKLEGADADWHDAGTRRQAFYNHLGPKSYRFRVIACNSDGVWNEAGASWSFSVAPAFYQTIWFALASVLAGSLLLTGIYRLRVRQITAAMNARFDERLAERTRIARDLHDTLLQSIEGSRIVADDALKQRTDPGRLERALERLSGWLAQASEEGRSALSSLRSSAEEGNDLGQAFQRAGDECMLQRPIEFSVSIEGTAEEMHPIVRDEVYRIGYESIRNAFFHSGGSRLTVELNYRDGLSLRVRDNGKGMDPNLAAAGKGGHFGMLGMYERAARIKGKLTISSSPANGTQVELVVARSIAFHRPDPVRRSLSHKLTRLFKKGDRDEFL